MSVIIRIKKYNYEIVNTILDILHTCMLVQSIPIRLEHVIHKFKDFIKSRIDYKLFETIC